MAYQGATFEWMGKTWTVTWVGYDGWYIANDGNGTEKKFSPETWAA
jgi:hypothetical protein